MPTVEIKRIGDLTPDVHNPNEGTERGHYVLESSVRRHGMGRSILIDKHGRIVAGNKTHTEAGELGIEEVIVVHSDGKRLIAVQRDDVDLDTPEGRHLSIVDNRAGELGLEWDAGEIAATLEAGLDLSDLWRPEELSEILEAAGAELAGTAEPPEAQVDRAEELREKWGVEPGQLWVIESKTVPPRPYVTCPKCGRDVDL